MRLILLTLLLIKVMSGYAQKLPDCTNPIGSYETSYCSEQEFLKLDKALNDAYQLFKKSISEEQQRLLYQAQKPWVKIRDNDCELEQYLTRGGTGWYTNIMQCKARKTQLRIKELKRLYKLNKAED